MREKSRNLKREQDNAKNLCGELMKHLANDGVLIVKHGITKVEVEHLEHFWLHNKETDFSLKFKISGAGGEVIELLLVSEKALKIKIPKPIKEVCR